MSILGGIELVLVGSVDEIQTAGNTDYEFSMLRTDESLWPGKY